MNSFQIFVENKLNYMHQKTALIREHELVIQLVK
jgi:hypothetical protein